MPETRILFRHIDEQGLAWFAVYRSLGGYEALEKAIK